MANESTALGPPRCYTVFVDTNLDTHLAMIVSEGDTVRDLKYKIMIEHPNYFPNIGQISVHALKVKRKAKFYHLLDTMLVISAFTGVKGTWFLHADAASGQVRPIKDLQYLDPGASKLPHSFSIASGPAAETERNNLHIDYPLARVSNLKGLTSPQVGSRDLVNPLAPPDDLFGPGNKVGESQTAMNQGEKHVTEENSKLSSIGANEKHSESETLKRNDAASKEKDALKSKTECKKHKSRKRSGEVLSDNMLEDSSNSGSVVKKKRAPGKKVEDAFCYTVKSPSKHTDFGTSISSKESSKPGEELSQNCSKDKNKTTNAFMDGSLSKESENDSSSHSLLNGEKKELSKLQDVLDSRGLSYTKDIQDETDKRGKEEKVLLQRNHRVTHSEANKLNCKLSGTDETDKTIKDGIESSRPLYASGIVESGGPNHRGRKKSKKIMISDSKSRVSSSVAEHIDATGEVIPPISVPDKAFDSVHPGDKTDRDDDMSFQNEKIETDLTDETEKKEKSLTLKKGTKPISFGTSASNCKSLAMDELGVNTKDGNGSSTPLDASIIIDSGDPAHKIKKKSKKSKVSDKKSHGLSSDVEHTDASNPVNAFVDGHSAGEANGENIFLSPTETGKNLKIGYSGSGDGIIDNAQTDRVEVEESLLQKEQPNIMSSEAVISTTIEAQDLSDKRRKKSKKTRASKAKSHVSTSGVEHVDSAEEILPLVSESKQAFDGANPCDGTNKKEYISPENGEIEAPAMKSLNDPLIGSGKQDDLGSVNGADDLELPQIPNVEETAAFTDCKVKGKSKKSRQHSTSISNPPTKQEVADTGDPMLPTDGNKEEENASSKSLKKTRSRKKVLVNKLSEKIPESSQQYETPDNKGSSQTISDALENNEGRPLVAVCEDGANNHVDRDKVNFIDYFVSKQDHHEVASSAKETLDKDAHIRKNNEMKAVRKNQKLDGHFRAALHDKENSLNSVDNQQKKKKHLVGSFDASQLQGSLKKDKQGELAVRPNEKGNAAARLGGETFHGHDRLKSIPHKDAKRETHDASGVLSAVPQFHSPSGAKPKISSKEHIATLETSSSSTENSQDRDYKKNREARSKANHDHAAVRKTNNKKVGKVVNSSNKKDSLLATPKTIFKDSSDSDKSSEVDGEVNYSETSTRTPDNSSTSDYSEGENATDLDSPRTGPYSRKRKENGGEHISHSQRSNMTMDMIFRSSSSYKKAKLTASQAQVNVTESPPVDFVPDSQA